MPGHQNVLGYAILYKFWYLGVFLHIYSKWKGENYYIYM